MPLGQKTVHVCVRDSCMFKIAYLHTTHAFFVECSMHAWMLKNLDDSIQPEHTAWDGIPQCNALNDLSFPK